MLKMGLLWFDDNPKRPLAEKLDEAAERYEERFEARPTLVHLNPAQAEGLKHRRLRVYSDASLRRNYFLIGVDEVDSSVISPAAPQPVTAPARPAPAEAGELVAVSGSVEVGEVGEERARARRGRRSRGAASVSSVVSRRARASRAS